MCELCKLVNGKIITQKYYSNSLCVIVDCSTCKIPMVVFNEHRQPTENEVRKIEAVVRTIFPNYRSLRDERKIKDHWHKHIIQ